MHLAWGVWAFLTTGRLAAALFAVCEYSLCLACVCSLFSVWKQCWDWYGSYSSSSQTDPRGPTSGSLRVNRGGGWGYYAYLCRAASRDYGNPAISGYYGGFRSVLPAGQ